MAKQLALLLFEYPVSELDSYHPHCAEQQALIERHVCSYVPRQAANRYAIALQMMHVHRALVRHGKVAPACVARAFLTGKPCPLIHKDVKRAHDDLKVLVCILEGVYEKVARKRSKSL